MITTSNKLKKKRSSSRPVPPEIEADPGGQGGPGSPAVLRLGRHPNGDHVEGRGAAHLQGRRPTLHRSRTDAGRGDGVRIGHREDHQAGHRNFHMLGFELVR